MNVFLKTITCLTSLFCSAGLSAQTTLIQADFTDWSAGSLQSGGALTSISNDVFVADTAIPSLTDITTNANTGGFLLDQNASGTDSGVNDYATPNENLNGSPDDYGIIFSFTADTAIELTSLDFTGSIFTSRGGFHTTTNDWEAVTFAVYAGTGLGGTQQGSTWSVDPAARTGSSSAANHITDTITGTAISLSAGTYTVYLSVEDTNTSGSYGGFNSITLKGNGNGELVDPTPDPVVITTASLTTGLQDAAYSEMLMASGGIAATEWSLTSGPLPAGLSLSTAGLISGTPTESGTFPLTVTATDSANSGNNDSIALSLLIVSSTARDDDPRPNIVIINVDDMGWTDVASFGSDFNETPNIDTLAADGLKFTSAYAACSVCSPTRAAMLTGKYPSRVRITNYIGGSPDLPPSTYEDSLYSPVTNKVLEQPVQLEALPLEETTYAEIAKSAGYVTMHLGKWHLGGTGYLPQNQGFDSNLGGDHRGQPPSYFDPYNISSLPNRQTGEYLTDREADEAETFIRDHADVPFLLNYWPYGVHAPLQGRADKVAYYEAKTPGTNHKNATYAAMVESIDDAVGQIRATLAELEIEDNTLIIFTSDNGLFGGTGNNVSPATGFKGQSKEGGIRVPQIVYWPGVTTPASVTDVPVSSIDIYPTLCAAMGATVPNPEVIDGVDMTPLLTGHPENFPDRAIYWHFPHYRDPYPYSVVRSGDWKLVRWYADTQTTYRLTNLATDIAESTNLANSNPTKRLELEALMDAISASTTARIPRPIAAANYAQWLWQFMATTPADQRAAEDDPNQNGIRNAEEFISGGSPGIPGATPLTRPEIVSEDGGKWFHHSIDASVNPTAVTVRWSTNLVDWYETDLTTETLSPMNGFSRFRSKLVDPKENNTLFYQLVIEP